MNHENSHQCSVCESLPATKTYTHTQIIKKKVKEKQRERGGVKVKVMLQSQKHSALPRRVFVCTTRVPKKKKKKKRMGANCTGIKKKIKANIYKLFLVKAGENTYTLNYTFYK